MALLPRGSPGNNVARSYLVSKLSGSSEEVDAPTNLLLPLLENEDELAHLPDPWLRRALKAATVRHEPDFVRNVSRTYFGVIAEAIRKVDPNHLFLGAKFDTAMTSSSVQTCDTFDDVLQGSKGYVDVHSIDMYAYTPGRDALEHYHKISGVPWILGEVLGFPSTINLSQDPNHAGAGPRVPTQVARAHAWTAEVRKILAIPFVVGFNHFTWADEPPGGRGAGGEDCNYGFVSINGTVYEEVAQAMLRIMPQADALHRGGKSSNRCGSDTADFYSGMQGQLQSMGKSLCLTADPSGIVTAIACVQPSAFSSTLSAEEQEVMERQTWAVVQVGGRVGHRLQNAHTRGCLHLWLSQSNDQLRADGNCTEPTDWLWPPAWEHDSDCSLMQFCPYPNGWGEPNVCVYNQSCAALTPIQESRNTAKFRVHVSGCAATATEQQFAFVRIDTGAAEVVQFV